MGNDAIIIRLRELWENRDWKEFHRVFNLGKWMMKKEDVEKIEKALIQKGMLKAKPLPSGEQQDLLNYAMEIMPGSKIID